VKAENWEVGSAAGRQRLREGAEARENRHDAPSPAAGAERRAGGRVAVAARQRPPHRRVRRLDPLPPHAWQRPPRRARARGKLQDEQSTAANTRDRTGGRAVVAPRQRPPRRRWGRPPRLLPDALQRRKERTGKRGGIEDEQGSTAVTGRQPSRRAAVAPRLQAPLRHGERSRGWPLHSQQRRREVAGARGELRERDETKKAQPPAPGSSRAGEQRGRRGTGRCTAAGAVSEAADGGGGGVVEATAVVVKAAEGQQLGGEKGGREDRQRAVAMRGDAQGDAGASGATRHDSGGDHPPDRLRQATHSLSLERYPIAAPMAELHRNIEYFQLGGSPTRPSAEGH